MVDKLFVATKAFIVHNSKVLVLRESSKYSDGTHAGKYDLPGGRLKPGEAWSDGLKREILEETGLQIEIGVPIAVSEWRPVVKGEQWQIVAIFFECKTDSPAIKLSDDHDDFLWIDVQDYDKYPMPPKNLLAFEEYLKKQQSL